MAYFGLQWVVEGTDKKKPSEADELGIIELQKNIRKAGVLLAESRYSENSKKYKFGQSLLAESKAWDDYIAQIFQQVSPEELQILKQLVVDSPNDTYIYHPNFETLNDDQKYIVSQYNEYLKYVDLCSHYVKYDHRYSEIIRLILVNLDLWNYELELATQRKIQKENEVKEQNSRQKEILKDIIKKVFIAREYKQNSNYKNDLMFAENQDQETEMVLNKLNELIPESKDFRKRSIKPEVLNPVKNQETRNVSLDFIFK